VPIFGLSSGYLSESSVQLFIHDKNISDYLKHKDVSATYNQIANINGPSIIITLA